MKKIFTISLVTIFSALFLTSCVRETIIDNGEDYWLVQERGDVVFRDSNCGYFVVETNYGYSIIRSTSGYRPYEGSILYGNFGQYGIRNFYNYTTGTVFSGDVVEVDLSYAEAQIAIEYYCPYAVGYKIKQSPVSEEKKKRVE